MPLYDFRCDHCGTAREVYRTLSDDTKPECCDHEMTQIHTSAPYGSVRMEAHYRCPATGQGVTTWKQRREIMARHNLVDVSDMPASKVIEQEDKKWAAIRKKAAELPGLPPGTKPEDFLPALPT